VSDRHGLVVDKGLMKSVCLLEQTSERQPLVHGSRHVIIFMIISYQIFFHRYPSTNLSTHRNDIVVTCRLASGWFLYWLCCHVCELQSHTSSRGTEQQHVPTFNY